MIMCEMGSLDEVHAMPKNKWGIPEPPAEGREDGVYCGLIDLVLVPGVAFDSSTNRLGHGKGYYGTLETHTIPVLHIYLAFTRSRFQINA